MTTRSDAVPASSAGTAWMCLRVAGLDLCLDARGTGIPMAVPDCHARFLAGGALLDQQAVADALGRAVFRLKSGLPGTYQVCIANVIKPGCIYEPSRNTETCDTVTVP